MSDFPEKDVTAPEDGAQEQDPADVLVVEDAEDAPGTDAGQETEDGASTIFTKPVHDTEKKPAKKGGHMTRNIIAALVILCVLAGSVFAIYRFLPAADDEDASSASSNIVIPLISMTTNDIARIDLKNETGAYSVYPTEATGDTSSDDGLTWHIDGVDDSYLDTYAVSGLADATAVVQAFRRIGEDEDLAAYGLDNPRISAAVTCNDADKSYTLYFGNDAPNGDGTYIKLGDNPQIYLTTTSVRDTFNRPNTFYTDVTMVRSISQTADNSSYFDEDGALRSFDLITISGKDHPQTMEFIPNPYSNSSLIPYLMRSPVSQNVDGEVFDKIFKIISSGMTADGGYAFDPTAEQIASYGLDNPGTIIRFKVGATDLTLKFGNVTDDGYYPVMVGDRQVIYKIASGELPAVDLAPQDYFSPVLFMDDITSVKSLEMKTADSDRVYQFAHGVDDNDAATLEVTNNGQVLSTADFRNLYQYILRCPASDFTMDAAPAGVAPSLEITVRYMDDARPALTISFVRQSDRRYHVTVNGTPLGYSAVNTVDQLIQYDKDYAEGKTIPSP